jgi:hypothetical protein
MLAIVRAADNPAAFDAWRKKPGFAAIGAHPFTGGFGRRYYPLVFGDKRRDESFAVVEQNKPLLLVPCSLGEGALDHYGLPTRFFSRGDLASATAEAALTHLDALAISSGLRRMTLQDNADAEASSALGNACRKRSYIPTPHIEGFADLGAGEPGLRKGLRKSFKSLLNWGQRNMAIEIIDQAHPDRTLFRRYQDFHQAIAGRSTRPQESWDAMFDWIASGHGELILASLDGELVAGTMVVDGASIAFYASGVYDRERFDKPLAHWPLWLSMLHAGARGMTIFDIGDLPLEGTASPKEVNIGYFKRGFATRKEPWTVWMWEKPEARKGSP